MDLQQFAHTHVPALEQDEARFGVLIGIISAAASATPPGLATWTLGAPGHCAVRGPHRSIVVGALEESECRQLAQAAIGVAASGVLGDGDRPHWFAEAVAAMGVQLGEPIPQRIHVLRQPPRHPQAAGTARRAAPEDARLLYAWLSAFHREATPHAPPPSTEEAERAARSGRFLLWTVDGGPVAMAAINRNLRSTGSIGAVYTPPEHRGRGYAGSVTATLAERLLADGKAAVCLYTDLRNPISNRCYAKLGFVPHCDAAHYPPAASAA